MAGGRNGGSLLRIETFSAEHVVAVLAPFHECPHANLKPEEAQRPGICQVRTVSYRQPEIDRIEAWMAKQDCATLESLWARTGGFVKEQINQGFM
eukprot:7475800-Prorocentrum_lima.AAC.1